MKRKISDEIIKKLFTKAKEVMQYANVEPERAVGAAVLGESGKIYGGCCFAGCPLDYCAERVALLKALSEGEKGIQAILVTYRGKFEGKEDRGGMCGVCMNAVYQLAGRDLSMPIYTWPIEEEGYRMIKLGDIYPAPY